MILKNMKINVPVRLRNPVFWAQVSLAIFTPILAYFGLTGADITSWPMLGQTMLAAVSNPYVCVLVVVSVWNAVNDPTTSGLGDSTRALAKCKPD